MSCTTSTEYDYELSSDDSFLPANYNKKVATIALDFVDGLNKGTRSSAQPRIESIYPWLCKDIFQTTRSTADNFLPDTLLYIVNFADSAGYAIVSASDYLNAVVAFVENGSLTPQTPINNVGFRMFLDGFADYVDSLVFELVIPDTVQMTPEYYVIDTIYSPILQTKWGQSEPFNTYCYSPNEELSLAGCVPVALGQIFSRFRRPVSYNNSTYDWSNILTGNIPTNDMGRESVARLMHDIGVLTDTSYSPVSSSTNPDSIGKCFDAFHFTFNHVYGYSYEDCVNSIVLNKPVLIGGSRFNESTNSMSGHAWVIDGIIVRHSISQLVNGEWIPADIQRYVHCNWGWNGIADGYFLSGVFDVMGRSFDDNGNPVVNNYNIPRHYQYGLRMFHNIKSPLENPIVGPILF